jgi:hypothetical protein
LKVIEGFIINIVKSSALLSEGTIPEMGALTKRGSAPERKLRLHLCSRAIALNSAGLVAILCDDCPSLEIYSENRLQFATKDLP